MMSGQMEKQVLETMRSLRGDMFHAEKKVVNYVLNNPYEVIHLNVTDLAEASGVSDATVVRMCKRIGYKGFYQMKLALAEELGKYQMTGYSDPLDNPQNAREVIKCQIRDLVRIADLLDNDKAEQVAEMICGSRRVFVLAVGNTIPVAMDFSFRLCRLGISATCSAIIEHGMVSMVNGDRRDLLIAISHSGSSRHVIQAVEMAEQRNMSTVAVTSSSSSPLARMTQISLLTTVENPLFGEYGLASHIYDQAVLDALVYLSAAKMDKNIKDVEELLAEYKM